MPQTPATLVTTPATMGATQATTEVTLEVGLARFAVSPINLSLSGPPYTVPQRHYILSTHHISACLSLPSR